MRLPARLLGSIVNACLADGPGVWGPVASRRARIYRVRNEKGERPQLKLIDARTPIDTWFWPEKGR